MYWADLPSLGKAEYLQGGVKTLGVFEIVNSFFDLSVSVGPDSVIQPFSRFRALCRSVILASNKHTIATLDDDQQCGADH